MQRIIFFFICLAIINHVAAQTDAKVNWLATVSSYLNGGRISVQDIATGDDSSIVAVGYFDGYADFDPGPDTFNLSALNDEDIFIAKYSKLGQLVYAYSFGEVDNSHENTFYTNPLDDAAYAVALDAAGNAYVTGVFGKSIDMDPGPGKRILSSPGSREVFIASFGPEGSFHFAVNIGSTNSNSQTATGKSITLDKEGNIYVGGTFSGKNIDFDPSPGKALFSSAGKVDIFFAKYDNTGKYLFAKAIGGNSFDDCHTLKLDDSKNIILYGVYASYPADFDPGAGTAYLSTNGDNDIFIAKYDSSGNYVFAKGIGSTRGENAASITVANDQSLVFTGSFNSRFDFDAGPGKYILEASYYNGQVFICKYDKDGNFSFAFEIGGPVNDEADDIVMDDHNLVCVTGTVNGNTIDFDPGADSFYLPATDKMFQIYLAKYTIAGDFVTASGIGTNDYYPTLSLSPGKDGSLFLAGIYADSLDIDPSTGVSEIYAANNASALFVASYNTHGKLYSEVHTDTYENYYNASNTVMASAMDSAGNVYTAGRFSGRFDFDPGPGTVILESMVDYNESAWFAKYNPDGKLIFAKALIGDHATINDMAIDKNENIYFIGSARGYTDFDPSPNTKYINNSDTPVNDIWGYFFAKYDKNGNLLFANGEDGFNNLKPNAIAVDKNKNIYISGGFGQNVDFDPGPGRHVLKHLGLMDIFMAKYDPEGKYLFAKMIGAKKDGSYTNDIKINSRGDIVLCGSMECDSLDFDITAGHQYVKAGGYGNGVEVAFTASYDRTGKLIFAFSARAATGYFNSTMNAVCIDKQDNFFTGGICFGGVDFDPDTSVFQFSNAYKCIYFASYDRVGKFRYAKNIVTDPSSTSLENDLTDICLDRYSNIYIGGKFGSIGIDCDPSPDTAILYNKYYDKTNNLNTDMFIARYDSSGIYQYAFNLEGDSAVGYNWPTRINVDKDDHIIFTGSAKTKIDFDPGPGVIFLQPTTTQNNPFIVKYSQPAIARKEKIMYAMRR